MFRRPSTHYSDEVLEQLLAGHRAHVPILWMYEVASAFARAQRLGSITAESYPFAFAALLARFFASRGSLDLFFFGSFPTLADFAGAGCAMPVLTAIAPNVEPIVSATDSSADFSCFSVFRFGAAGFVFSLCSVDIVSV